MQGRSFISCKAPSGYGGAVYLTGTLFTDSLEFSSLSFQNCQDSQTNANIAIFISATQFSSFLEFYWNPLFPSSSFPTESEDVYMGQAGTLKFELARITFTQSEGKQPSMSITLTGLCHRGNIQSVQLSVGEHEAETGFEIRATLNIIGEELNEERRRGSDV